MDQAGESYMPNNLKRFLAHVAGGLLGVALYGIGRYLITGYIDIEPLLRSSVMWVIGGAIGFWIAIKMLDL